MANVYASVQPTLEENDYHLNSSLQGKSTGIEQPNYKFCRQINVKLNIRNINEGHN